jgi:hypothetical protein
MDLTSYRGYLWEFVFLKAQYFNPRLREMFENIKGEIRSGKSKNKQYNDQTKEDNR